MGGSSSRDQSDEEEDGDDALSRAMNPRNFMSWREREHEALRESVWQALELQRAQAQPHWVIAAAAAVKPGERIMRIIYTSRLIPSEETRPNEVLSRISAVAMRNNAILQVGGQICFTESSSCVVQELEGPETAVKLLLSKLERDPRHENLLILHRAFPTERRNAGFGMRMCSEPGEKEFYSSSAIGVGKAVHAKQYTRLVYASLLCASGHAAYALVDSIVRAAAAHNPRLRIGGELFLDVETRLVVQVLEGPDAVVRALFATIDRDLRHERCTLLSEEAITAADRRYSDWGMSQSNWEKQAERLGTAVSNRAAALLSMWQQKSISSASGDRTVDRVRPRIEFAPPQEEAEREGIMCA